jgi:coenzyme F420 biosynthesis associated uncharacterized protein
MADASVAGAAGSGTPPEPPELVDWDLAVSTARRLVKAGPATTPQEAARVVADLRRLAAEADEHVRRYTGLAPSGPPTPVAVVDRAEWARSNAAGLRLLTGPLFGRLADKRSRPAGAVSLAVGRRVTGLQVGTVLAFLAGKVLGQYEVFLPPAEGSGRLSLVAPNIVAAERALRVDPRDFRMWVCLHEQTHRVQFGAVPWLREHLEREIAEYVAVTDLDPAVLAERLRAVVGALTRRTGDSLLEVLQTPDQRAVLDRVQAVMSLLEGHADQVMDAVGPQVVPSVATIRARFEVRRAGGSPLDRVLRRLLGLDLKLQQYRQGGSFVRAVVAAVGVEAFNRVWESPETLPTRAEIADPAAWMDRVLGRRAA